MKRVLVSQPSSTFDEVISRSKRRGQHTHWDRKRDLNQWMIMDSRYYFCFIVKVTIPPWCFPQRSLSGHNDSRVQSKSYKKIWFKDGARSCFCRAKRRLRCAMWCVGSGNHCSGAGRVPTAFIRLTPHAGWGLFFLFKKVFDLLCSITQGSFMCTWDKFYWNIFRLKLVLESFTRVKTVFNRSKIGLLKLLGG